MTPNVEGQSLKGSFNHPKGRQQNCVPEWGKSCTRRSPDINTRVKGLGPRYLLYGCMMYGLGNALHETTKMRDISTLDSRRKKCDKRLMSTIRNLRNRYTSGKLTKQIP